MHQPYTAPTLNSTRPALQFSHTSAPIQPPQTNPPTTPFHTQPHKHTPQIPHPYSPTNTQQPQTPHRRQHDAGPPTLSHSQAGCRRSRIPVRNSTGQASDRIRPQPQLDRPGIRQPIIRQAAHRIRLDKVRPDRTGSGHDVITIRQARNQAGHNLTGRVPDMTRTGSVHR